VNFLDLLPPFAWNAFWWSQIFAAFALICDGVSFQFKTREHILLILIFSSVFLGVHFFLLGQIVAAVIAIVSIARKVMAYFYPESQSMYVFLLIGVLVTFYFYEHWHNILAFLAMCLLTVGNFRSHDHPLRLWQMAGTSTWLLHNVLTKTPMGVVVELVFLIGQGIGYYRHYGRKK